MGNTGGFEAEAVGWHGQHYSAEVTLPPLRATETMGDHYRSISSALALLAQSRAVESARSWGCAS
jgi:hypothetical protein